MQNGRQSALIKTYEMFENESRSVDHDSVVAIIYIVFWVSLSPVSQCEHREEGQLDWSRVCAFEVWKADNEERNCI